MLVTGMMEINPDNAMKERRATDRRNLTAKALHVVVSKRGQVMNADRRHIPDRRLNNIKVEFISIDDFYLENSQRAYHS